MYYIYQKNEYGICKQLGFAFNKAQAIEEAKKYANKLFGKFSIEVHFNGAKSVKVFDTLTQNKETT